MHTKTLTEHGGFRKQSVLELDNHFVGVDDVELAAQQFADHVGIGMVRMQPVSYTHLTLPTICSV